MIIIGIAAYILVGLAVGQLVYLPRRIRKTITGDGRGVYSLTGLAEEMSKDRIGREVSTADWRRRAYEREDRYSRCRDRYSSDDYAYPRLLELKEEIEGGLRYISRYVERVEQFEARLEEVARIEAGLTDPFVNFDYARIRREGVPYAAAMALVWLPYLLGIGWLELSLHGRKTPQERRQASVRHELHMHAIKLAIEAYERELAAQREAEVDELDEKLKELD